MDPEEDAALQAERTQHGEEDEKEDGLVVQDSDGLRR